MVQPFEALVAVTVYVPAALTVAGLAAFVNVPPFHTIVFPAETPVKVAVGDVQVIVPLPGEVTVGGVVFAVTVYVEVLVQPFEALVAVTVYVPAALTVAGLAAFVNVPPFQTIVFPAEMPVKVAVGDVQVIVLLPGEVTVGGVPTVTVTFDDIVPFVH